jgi:NADPH2:quinone reductase
VKQRFALKDSAEAHRQLEARKTIGSTILTI